MESLIFRVFCCDFANQFGIVLVYSASSSSKSRDWFWQVPNNFTLLQTQNCITNVTRRVFYNFSFQTVQNWFTKLSMINIHLKSHCFDRFQLAFTVLQVLKLHYQRHVTCLLQFQLSQLSKFDLPNVQRLNYILKVTCLILTGVN